MRGGAVVALVSDAGMPLVSDPGYVLVQGCVAAGLAVEVLPGPSAALAALVASALPSDAWRFVGFLPRKRAALLEAVFASPETVVAFESPRRVGASLAVAAPSSIPARPVAVCRELTKVHEEVVRGTAAELAARYAESEARGEVVLVIGGAPARDGRRPGGGRRRAPAGRGGRARHGPPPRSSPTSPAPPRTRSTRRSRSDERTGPARASGGRRTGGAAGLRDRYGRDRRRGARRGRPAHPGIPRRHRRLGAGGHPLAPAAGRAGRGRRDLPQRPRAADHGLPRRPAGGVHRLEPGGPGAARLGSGACGVAVRAVRAGCRSRVAGARARALLDAYGLDKRDGFVALVRERMRVLRETIRAGAEAGEPACLEMWGTEHSERPLADRAWVARHRRALEAAVGG